jgi:hypothetical protein
MIPLYRKTADFTEPPEAIYHLLTRDGLFRVMRSPLFTAVMKTEGVPDLEPQKSSLQLAVPKVPRQLMERIYGFFRTVYERWDAEAVVLLYYSHEQRVFRTAVPKQTIYRYRIGERWRTEGRVSYGYHKRPEGFVKLGDAHSHCDLPAFYSCVDDMDDREDGLRIVLGDLHRPLPSVSASFVASGHRFRLPSDDVLEDFIEPVEPPEDWMRQIACEYERPAPRVEEARQ